MIFGVEASAPSVAITGGATLMASADFKNGVYSYSGATLAASDIVTTPARISASGFSIGADDVILNDFSTLLLTQNWTVVLTVNPVTTHDQFWVNGYLTGENDTITCCCGTSSHAQLYWENHVNVWGYFDSVATITTGVQTKIAFSYNSSHRAVSLNGAAAVFSDVVVSNLTLDYFTLAQGNDGYIEKLEIYDAVVSDSDLATLSA